MTTTAPTRVFPNPDPCLRHLDPDGCPAWFRHSIRFLPSKGGSITLRITRAISVFSSTLVLAAVLSVTAGPVSAAGEPGRVLTSATNFQPDGWVRLYGYWSPSENSWFPNPPTPKAWAGKNIYNTTGINQTSTYRFDGAGLKGDLIAFQVAVQNDGSKRDRFRISGPGSSSFRYYVGNSNITVAVRNGAFTTPFVAPGAVRLITVWLDASAPFGSRLTSVTSVGDPTKKDAVKIAFKLARGCC